MIHLDCWNQPRQEKASSAVRCPFSASRPKLSVPVAWGEKGGDTVFRGSNSHLITYFRLCASTGSVPGKVSLMVEGALTSYVLTVLGQTLILTNTRKRIPPRVARSGLEKKKKWKKKCGEEFHSLLTG